MRMTMVASVLALTVGFGTLLPSSAVAAGEESEVQAARAGLKKVKHGNKRRTAPRQAEESRLGEELVIYFQDPEVRKVLGVTYGQNSTNIELFRARVAINNQNHDYSALQVRLPANRLTDLCAQGALITQRVEALGPERKDIQILARGTLENNGGLDDEGIVTVSELRSCFFQ